MNMLALIEQAKALLASDGYAYVSVNSRVFSTGTLWSFRGQRHMRGKRQPGKSALEAAYVVVITTVSGQCDGEMKLMSRREKEMVERTISKVERPVRRSISKECK